MLRVLLCRFVAFVDVAFAVVSGGLSVNTCALPSFYIASYSGDHSKFFCLLGGGAAPSQPAPLQRHTISSTILLLP